MKVSGSFLKIQNEIDKIEQLNKQVDYMHYDIMDGNFVANKTLEFEDIKKASKFITKPQDVHLMVKDIHKYVDMYQEINPEFITFHYEATTDIENIIKYIKDKNIKVGISINPNTDVTVLAPYLDKIDLVLLMSVMPGEGGQEYIDVSNKINWLKKNKSNFLIEVDGGINEKTIKYVKDADIVVVGSYITESDNYKEQVSNIKKNIKNAFTLAELMGVIVILSILAVVVTLTVDRSIKNSRKSTCLAQEKNIIESAKVWGTDNPSSLPTKASNNKQVKITSLISSGYLDDDIKNPITSMSYAAGDYVLINVTDTDNDYQFTVKYTNAAHQCS